MYKEENVEKNPLTELDHALRDEYVEFQRDYLKDNPPGSLWSFDKFLIYQIYELRQRMELERGNSDTAGLD